jgi:mono/diheme cytochrome c family protein
METPTMNQALIGALGAALLALGASGIAWSDHDHGRADPDRADLGTPANARYQSECGGCHLAYPPGLLPAAGWGQIMDTLAKHFGDDASLDLAATAEIRSYLRANAADRGLRTRPGKATSTPGNQGTPRITQTRYFLRKHDEVPTRLVSDNPKIGSFSNCQACHGGAAKGNFDEDDVNIPGVGRWED